MSAPRKPGPRGIDWDAVPDLGVATDYAIARRLGVTHATVLQQRRKRGIPAAGPPGRPRKRPSVPASEAALTQTVESALAAQGLREVFPWHSAAAATFILCLCLLALAVRGCT